MKKIMQISVALFTALAIVLIAIIFLLFANPLSFLDSKYIHHNRFNSFYQEDSLGNIYKDAALTDSLMGIEGFKWKSNYIQAGTLRKSNISWNQHRIELLKSTTAKQNTYNEIRIGNRTLYLLRVNSLEENRIITYVYDYSNNVGLHIYGADYSLEDSRALSTILLYGQRMDFDVVREEFPASILFDDLDSNTVDGAESL